jgi:hypothetical protein
MTTKESNTPPTNGVTLPEAVIFGILVFSGLGVLAIVIVTNTDWFYPTLAYAFAAYMAWQRFLSDDDDAEDDDDAKVRDTESTHKKNLPV